MKTQKFFGLVFVLTLLVTLGGTAAASMPPSANAQGSGCTPTGLEVPDNGMG